MFCKPEDDHGVSVPKPSTGRAVLLLKAEVEMKAKVGFFFVFHQKFAFLLLTPFCLSQSRKSGYAAYDVAMSLLLFTIALHLDNVG